MASSKKDFLEFPKPVIQDVGHALWLVQEGDMPPNAKPLRGFGGASILEIVDNYDGDTYRAVYTVRFEEAVYILHCFEKKSKSGVATPRRDVALVRGRLKLAEEESKRWHENLKKL
jgi:phage-related protein